MTRFLLVLPMVFFGTVAAVLWVYLVTIESSGPLPDDLVPELIGFSLEGFILIGLLTLVQHVRETARKRQLRLSLRGSFRSLLSRLDVAFLEPYAEPVSARRLERDPALVGELSEALTRKHPDLDTLIALREEAREVLPLARDLVAVAAQLSVVHMNWWVAIVDSIRRIGEAEERAELEQATHDMLVNIQEFDRVEY